MDASESVSTALLDKDVDAFGLLCAEVNQTLQDSNSKLLKLKDKLIEMDRQQNEKNSNFQYLDVKSMLILNYVMSYQYYMLLKAEGADLESHEIFNRLAYLRLIIEKLKPLDKKIDYQIDKLLRSAVTQSQGNSIIPSRLKAEDNLKYKPSLKNLDTKHVAEQDKKSHGQEESENVEEFDDDEIDSDEIDKFAIEKQKEYSEKQKEYADKHKQKDEGQVYQAIKFNPVAMADNKSKKDKQRKRDSKRITRIDLVREMKHDLLELPDEVNYGIASGNKRLIEEDRAEQKLEMEYFKRVSYTRKEAKERDKRRRELNKSDYTSVSNGLSNSLVKEFKRIDEFMNKTYSDDEDAEMKKYLDKQKFLDEHRQNRRDKKSKFKQDEDDSDQAGNRQPWRGKNKGFKGKKFNKKW